MTTEQQTTTTLPAPPANAAEASARLEALKSDQDWRDKFLAGNSPQVKEYRDLEAMITGTGDEVDDAMAGVTHHKLGIPDASKQELAGAVEWMRSLGINDGTIRQTIADHQVTADEYRAVQNLKSQKMRSTEFKQAYLAGEPDAVREMTLINIVLSSEIKETK